ncbi:hypothetical protein RUND412_007801 [Rhizina undulata]
MSRPMSSNDCRRQSRKRFLTLSNLLFQRCPTSGKSRQIWSEGNLDDDETWPETSIIRDRGRYFQTTKPILSDSDKHLQAEAFYKLLAGDQGRIFKFLSSAPKLKKLSLGFDWGNCILYKPPGSEHVVAPLAKIFGDNFVWKHLEAFYFDHGDVPIHAEELKHFWACHSTTLKIFGLYRPHLETGTWQDVFGFIKEQPGLCLENIVIIELSEESEKNGK